PDAAAVAALMLGKNPCRTPAQIQGALVSAAADIGAPGADAVAGAGRLDALSAIEAVPLATCRTDADCDDGDACTADTCAACACMHQTGCDDGDACTIDACDPTAGCTATPIAGYPGVACVCGRDLAGTCGGTAPPRAVRRL